MPLVLRDILRLARLCAATRAGRIGLLQFAAVLALGLAGVQVGIRLIAWTAAFFDALQRLDVAEAVRQIGIFFLLTAISAALFLTAAYWRKLLQIRWRTVLTEHALSAWFSDRAYWHLRDGQPGALDNPDQRIAEDCRIYVEKLTTEGLELVTNLVALASYGAILWSLSTFPLSFSPGGVTIEIPRYMVIAAPLYVALASWLTHVLGAPLKALTYEQQRREADFRYTLARLRDHAEAVALAGGESAERGLIAQRYAVVAANWVRLSRRELILGVFTRPYMQTVLRIPLFLALPAYLAGRVTLGGLMQLGSAFQNVVTTLSWFVFSYRDLAELAATASRLARFLDSAGESGNRPRGIGVVDAPGASWSLRGLKLATPGARPVAEVEDIDLQPGETVWIQAPSGYGKSTLIRALAGLWLDGEGTIRRPPGRACFLPQHVYWPLGTLRDALAYPGVADQCDPATCRAALAVMGLPNLARVPLETRAEEVLRDLSGGEKQRLALARLLLEAPNWAFLDEATSALDAAAEADVLTRLRTQLPRTTLVLVSHRRPPGIECHWILAPAEHDTALRRRAATRNAPPEDGVGSPASL